MNNDLYQLAEQQGIVILSFPLPSCKSVSLKTDEDSYYIGIDENKLNNSVDERIHLAHEMGHCFTDTFYNEYSPVDLRGKHEETADRWAIKKLINKDELESLLNDGLNVYELSEHFNVSEEYIRKAYHLYFEVKPINFT